MFVLLHHLIQKAKNRWPDKTAIIETGRSGRRATYRQLEARSRLLCGQLLSKGLKKGERVGILAKNSIFYAGLYFAVSRAGGIAVPLNPGLDAVDLSRQVEDCRLSALYFDKTYEAKAKNIAASTASVRFFIDEKTSRYKPKKPPKVRDKDPVTIIYTSGTTGEPLGVTLSHRNIISNNRSIVKYTKLKNRDSVCCVLPFYYIYGLSLLFSHVIAGGTVIIDNRFMYPNLVLDTIVKQKATGFAGVSSHYAIMLCSSNLKKRKLSSLRYFMQAGDRMPAHLTRELIKAFPDKEIYLMYGLSEASPRLTYLDPALVRNKPASIGQAVPGVRIKLVKESGAACRSGEEGEILAKGDNTMLGYWDKSRETARVIRDGWLHTNDLAFRDRDGDLYITGRKDTFIKVGANRVNPAEIEHIVTEDKRILEAAAVGVPDSILGEKLKLFIAPARGEKVSVEQVKTMCRQRLPAYKMPHEITILASIPKNSYGKINRESLKEA